MKLPRLFRARTRVPERRDTGYTDAVIAHILASNANGAQVAATATAALEACAGLIGRAFAGAAIGGRDAVAAAIDAPLLALMGRALIRRGEAVFYIEVDTIEGLALRPASNWSITGGNNPESWRYEITLAGPSDTVTVTNVNPASVVHLRYAVDAARPWRGLGPIQVAELAGRLSAETAGALADESGMSRGAFLPVPNAGEPDPDATESENSPDLRTDVRGARGNVLLVGDTQKPDGTTDPNQWTARRFGPQPPDSLVRLLDTSTREIYAACGIPVPLLIGGESASIREAWRLLLFSTLAPLGRMILAEFRAKLDESVTLDWTELRASDLQGRARAFQSMINGGMTIERAAMLSGLAVPEDE